MLTFIYQKRCRHGCRLTDYYHFVRKSNKKAIYMLHDMKKGFVTSKKSENFAGVILIQSFYLKD